jgi:hypothetical protein
LASGRKSFRDLSNCTTQPKIAINISDYKETIRNELAAAGAIYPPTCPNGARRKRNALGSLILQIRNGKRYTVDDAIDKRRGKSGSRGAFAGEPVVSVKQVISRPPPPPLPLDDFWPSVHLAAYFFAGFGRIVLGCAGEGHSVSLGKIKGNIIYSGW